MLKRIIGFTASLSVISSLTIAAAYTPPPVQHTPVLKPQTGFYLGGGVSADEGYYASKYTLTQEDPIVEVRPYSIDTPFEGWGSHAWAGDLSLGYSWQMGTHVYMAAELFGTHQFNHGTATSTERFIDLRKGNDIDGFPNARNRFRSLSLKSPWAVGLAFMPGYEIAPGTLFYTRLALISRRYELSGTSTLVTENPLENGLFGTGSRPVHKDVNLEGVQFGLGQNARVSNHLSVLTEYDWSRYQNFTAETTSGPNEFGRTLNRRFESCRLDHENLKLAIQYHFNGDDQGSVIAVSPEHPGYQVYVGATISRDFGNTPQTEIDNRFSFAGEDNGALFQKFIEQHDVSVHGWGGGLLLGIGRAFRNRLYLGAELSGSLTSAQGGRIFQAVDNDVDATFSDETRTEADFTGTVSIMPGIYVTPQSLLFARVGGAWTRFHVLEFGQSNPQQFTDDAFNFDYFKYRPGLLLGVGLDTMLDSNVSVRTEMDVTDYKSLRPEETLGEGNAVDIERQLTFKPMVEQFKLSLVYHFFDI